MSAPVTAIELLTSAAMTVEHEGTAEVLNDVTT
jgi:hypothetical protein